MARRKAGMALRRRRLENARPAAGHGRFFRAGAVVTSTPQEPDDDALIALDRLLRMTVPVPAGCVGAEGEPMSPEFVVSIQLVTDEGVHFIIRASGHSSDTLDLVATSRRLALLAPFEAGETREERIARTVAAPNPPYSGIMDEADFTRGEK